LNQMGMIKAGEGFNLTQCAKYTIGGIPHESPGPGLHSRPWRRRLRGGLFLPAQPLCGQPAPTLPGHLEGAPCPDVQRYTEWVRGWLWAQGRNRNLVLVGYTLGASISLQYGLDYPDEVAGLALMSVAMRPKSWAPGALEFRLRAKEEPDAYREWWEFQRNAMKFVAPDLRERLMERHRQVGPLSQYRDLAAIGQFDVPESPS
jgi:pimeloyl-ACP methyl ester carboxylesterase